MRKAREIREKKVDSSIILLIAPSTKITGMLTLEKAEKFNVGLFEDISFCTYAGIIGLKSSYNMAYVILARDNEGQQLSDPFTSNGLFIAKEPGKRNTHGTPELYFVGTDKDLKPAGIEDIGEIFPDDESLKEYKKLFESFCRETNAARREYIDIVERQREIAELYGVSNTPLIASGNRDRGEEIIRDLNIHSAKVGEILKRFPGMEHYVSPVYVAPGSGLTSPKQNAQDKTKVIVRDTHIF